MTSLEAAAKAAAEMANGGKFNDPLFYAPEHREFWMKVVETAIGAFLDAEIERRFGRILLTNVTAEPQTFPAGAFDNCASWATDPTAGSVTLPTSRTATRQEHG